MKENIILKRANSLLKLYEATHNIVARTKSIKDGEGNYPPFVVDKGSKVDADDILDFYQKILNGALALRQDEKGNLESALSSLKTIKQEFNRLNKIDDPDLCLDIITESLENAFRKNVVSDFDVEVSDCWYLYFASPFDDFEDTIAQIILSKQDTDEYIETGDLLEILKIALSSQSEQNKKRAD